MTSPAKTPTRNPPKATSQKASKLAAKKAVKKPLKKSANDAFAVADATLTLEDVEALAKAMGRA